MIVGVAAVITVPIGVLGAIYVTEFAGPRSRTARAVRTSLDLIQGLPSVVVGLFVFGLIVTATNTESGFAGSIALSIIMLPLVARSTRRCCCSSLGACARRRMRWVWRAGAAWWE